MILVIAAVQFVNIVDFMMVTPLGPFFTRSLDFHESDLALLLSAYTGAAGVAGLLGALFLDRFDRRPALAIAIGGLMLATALAGFATGFQSLVATRVIAGFFGGPATSLAMSIIADVVPAERRGQAMSTVMTAFSAAAVLGVPTGLLLAESGGWQMPFFVLAGAGALIVPVSIYFLPPLRAHLARANGNPVAELKALASRPVVLLSWGMTAVVMMAGFVVIPNFPAYLTGNLDVPFEHIKYLYLAGGVVSIFTFRVAGRLVDKFGCFKVGSVASVAFVFQMFFFAVYFVPGTPVALMFIAFMLCMNFRNVAYNTLASRVPEPEVRARFQSIQSAIQHASSALAGALSAWVLAPRPGGGLLHMERVGFIAIVLTLLAPWFFLLVERRVAGKPQQPLGITGPTPAEGATGPVPKRS